MMISIKEEGSRFGHFGGFVLDFTMFILYMLVDQPYSHRNQMVYWAKEPGFKPRHFAGLWFNPQCSLANFFYKINFSFSIFFLSFNLEKYFLNFL